MDEWRIVFYETASGRSPIMDFLRDLDRPTRTILERAIEQLRQLNLEAKPPLAKPMGDKLWELRTNTPSGAYRVFYFTIVNRRIVLLHAFQKKTQKTPPHELNLARKRMADYLRSHDDDET